MSKFLTFTFCLLCSFLNAEEIHIAKYKENKKAAISLTFDDGFVRQVDNALSVINEVGIKGTFFVNPGLHMKHNNRIQWPKLKEIIKQGHEVGNHSMFHVKLHTLNDENLEAEINNAHKLMKEHLGIAPVVFAAPGGTKMDKRIKSAILKNHIMNRDKAALYGDVKWKPWTDQVGKEYVDKDVNKGGWHVAMIHAIVGGFAPFHSKANFKRQCDYIKSKESIAWIAPMGEVAKYITLRDKTTVEAPKLGPNTAKFRLKSTLDKKLYDIPLTIVVPAKDAKKVSVTQGKQKLKFTLTAQSILIEAHPTSDVVNVSWK